MCSKQTQTVKNPYKNTHWKINDIVRQSIGNTNILVTDRDRYIVAASPLLKHSGAVIAETSNEIRPIPSVFSAWNEAWNEALMSSQHGTKHGMKRLCLNTEHTWGGDALLSLAQQLRASRNRFLSDAGSRRHPIIVDFTRDIPTRLARRRLHIHSSLVQA